MRLSIGATRLPLFCLALLAGCGPREGGPPQGGMPPAQVAVVVVEAVDVPVTFEYVGQTAGSREVEIRARVTGIIQKRGFVEGGPVKAGQTLFQLDPAPYQTAVAKADAEIGAIEARLAQFARQAVRLKPLVEARAVSQKEYDDAASAESITRADLKAAQARLAEARLNLGYARVDAPVAGLASRALKTEGALVSGPEVLLTTVSQVDPMFVNFGIPDADQLKLKSDIAAGRLRLPADGRLEVQVRLSDGSVHAKTAKLDFSDVRVNPSTGMSDARAALANPGAALRPGQFVRVRLSGATRIGAIRVPQRAVLEGPTGKFVYVAAPGDKGGLRAEARPVEVGDWAGDAWVIRSGLKAGERVIVDGVMKIGPGAPVAIAAPPDPAKAAPAGASGAANPGPAAKPEAAPAAPAGDAKK